MKPKAIILRGPGTNCDIETFSSFRHAGAAPELVHINKLVSGEKNLLDYSILALPGGFSYGDDISAGKIFAVKIRKLAGNIKKFIHEGRPVIGICNGFQVLVKTGFLPENKKHKQVSTLYTNECGHFLAKWVKLKVNKKSPCIFTKNLPDEIELPIAHGEGKFIVEDKKIMDEILNENLCSLTYVENPNGSMHDIAGITNKKGNCFGLMPHPERNLFIWQNPDRKTPIKEIQAAGYQIFKNSVDYAK
ncbi:MAG: phosphoribosylformylglycinamidine synthase I [Elusimicrobia bacterium]|nr:phosphoribosylformylglycinamidine synthase I [Elusimicrobiota bacterium]